METKLRIKDNYNLTGLLELGFQEYPAFYSDQRQIKYNSALIIEKYTGEIKVWTPYEYEKEDTTSHLVAFKKLVENNLVEEIKEER